MHGGCFFTCTTGTCFYGMTLALGGFGVEIEPVFSCAKLTKK